MAEIQENSTTEKRTTGNSGQDASLDPRFEAADILRSHRVPCVVWAEDTLQYYGARTVHLDLFLLVPDLEAARQCLLVAGYSDAPPNPRYKFVLELHALPRFKEGPYSDVESEGAIYVALIQASKVHFNLPSADTAVAARSYQDRMPSLPALIDSVIDAWLDASTTRYASHLACHLGYLHQYCPGASGPLFINELQPGHQEFYRSFLAGFGIGAKRLEWRHVRDSFATPEMQVKSMSTTI